MKHRATPRFWECYRRLTPEARRVADRAFELLRPSLHLKKVDDYWSARAGLHYRALALGIKSGLLWFWIGTHAEYDEIVG